MDELDNNSLFEEEPLVDETFFTPELQGTGNPLTDYYLSQRMAMLDPDASKYTERVQGTLAYIQTLTNDEVLQMVQDTLDASSKELQDFRLGMAALDQVTGPTLSAVEQEEMVTDLPQSNNQYELLGARALEYMKQFPVASADWINIRNTTLAMMVNMRAQELGVDLTPTLADVGGVFIPGRNLFDLGLGADYESRVNAFQNLAVDEQFQQWVDIIDEVLKGTDNDILRAERIAPFINPSDLADVKASLLMDVFDVATILPMSKLVTLAKHSHTPIKFMKNAGKTEEAGIVLNSATKTDDAAAAAGMAKEDAILSTSPFSAEGIDPRLVEGLSADVQKQIADEVSALMDTLKPLHDDTILKSKIWTEEEVSAAMAKHRHKFADTVRPVQTTQDGVIWEVSIVRKDDVLRTPDTIYNRAEFLRTQLVRMTDIDLPELQKMGDKDQIKNLKQQIVATKKEVANLNEIQRLDMERDSLVVRLNIAKQNNPVEELSLEIKEITKEIVKNKQQRGRVVNRLQTRTVETQGVESRLIKFTEDDFGNLQAIELGEGQSSLLNSPSTYIASMQKGLVSTARNIGFAQEAIRQTFQTAYKESLEKLSRRERKDLDDVLMQGDESGVMYSASELYNGVRTPDGLIKFTSVEQLSAYYRTRKLSDDLKLLNDQMVRRKLELQNFKAVQLPDGIGYARSTEALDVIPPSVNRILDLSTGKIRGRKRLLEGEKVYALRKPYETADETVRYVIARETDLKELPISVLQYKPGYVPRIRENIHFVGELVGKALVDGNIDNNFRRTVRFFDNPKDAETWTKDMQAKGATVDVKSSNQWFSENPGRVDNWEEQAFGGTFEGGRTDGKIPFNLDGTEAARMGAIESLEAYMNHVSNRMPATDFRIALVRRFINSAKDPITGKSVLNRSGDWRDPINLDNSSSAYQGLKAMQDWVKAQLAVPTTEERKWNEIAYSLARIVTRTKLPMSDRASAAIIKAGTQDLAGLAKTLAFHTTLGFLNPAQLIVQGMGFTTALALDPIGSPRRFAKYMALRGAISNSKRSPALEVRAAKAAGEDVTDFQIMMEAYWRTGLHQSVESVGDYGAATGMYSSRASLGYIADKALLFFREGERFTRGYGWIQAWDKLYKPGMKVTDDFINQVTNESIRYTLDLNRANKAYWQTGLLGIPTQFMQITAKFVENYLYKGSRLEAGWTAAEKTKIGLTNIALFGAAGIPAGNFLLDNALAYLKDESEFGLAVKDEKLLVALSGGMVENILNNLTGEEISFSSRVSIPNGIEQFFDNLFDEDATALEIAFGVFGEVPKRAYQALGQLGLMYSAILFEDASVDTYLLPETADELLNITSGYRNARKAAMWYSANSLLSGKGDKLMPLEERNRIAVVIAQGLGLAPKDVENFYEIRKYNRDAEKDIRESVDAWVKTVRRYQNSSIVRDRAGAERIAAMLRFSVSDLTMEQRREVAKRVSTTLAKDDYAIVREILQAAENAVEREGDLGSLESNTLLAPNQE